MKKTSGNPKEHSRILFILIPLFIVLFSVLTVGAVVLFSSYVRGKSSLQTEKVYTEAAVEFSCNPVEKQFTFQKGGDRIRFDLSMKNASLSPIFYEYKLRHNASSDLSSAILVYFDGKFIGTLDNLCMGNSNIEAALHSGFVAMNETDSSHEVTLELHEATPRSYYDGKTIGIVFTSYTQTVEATTHTVVMNEGEWALMVDDINSGMLSSVQTVVLGADLTLSKDYILKNPCNIDLNGHTLQLNSKVLTIEGTGSYKLYSSSRFSSDSLSLSGKIRLNSTGALLEMEELYSVTNTPMSAYYGKTVELVSYDEAKADLLVVESARANLKHGVPAQSTVAPFAPYSFYVQSGDVTTEHGSYQNFILTIPESVNSHVNAFRYKNEVLDHQVIGSGNDAVIDSIIQEELAHIPNDELTKVTSDLFLPSKISSKNAKIVWVSSNENTIQSNGKISDVVSDNAPVTLYAHITVNDNTYVRPFSFKVSSQNNETKFSYLIAQLSPITLEYVYNEKNDNRDKAFFYLPIVGNLGDQYDYRSTYKTPVSQNVSQTVWLGYKDINLTSIEYSVSNNYNYISVGQDPNGDTYAYLNTAVFYTFAQINIKGTFNTGESYTGVVNVTIKLGDDADLLNKVFHHVESVLNEVNILENILQTRREDGMKNERGDFYLPDGYMTYSIAYTIPESSKNIISEVVLPRGTAKNGIANPTDDFIIKVNPEYFYSSDTAIALSVTVQATANGGSQSETRGLYFNIPGVIKPDENGFSNLSVFNSVKYQIFKQLPVEEQSHLEAYLTNEGYTYANGFTVSASKVHNETGAYILMRDAEHPQVQSLVLNIKKPVVDYNLKVYNLLRLLEWGSGKEKINASSVVPGCSGMSDGKEYFTPTEYGVIETYLKKFISSPSALSSLLTAAFEKAPGKVISDGAKLNQKILELSITENTLDGTKYFKYVEVLQWATNEKDFPKESLPSGASPGAAPNLGIIGSEYHHHVEDDTIYISQMEEEVLKAYWRKQGGSSYAATFDSSTIVPTYLKDEGIALLVSELYSALNIKVSDFKSDLFENNPVVSSLDGSLMGLKHLMNLTDLRIYGETEDPKLSAFLATNTLTQFFNQTTTHNKEISTLHLVSVANNYVEFDLSFIERLTKLVNLNISNNEGIDNIGPLVNLKMEQLNEVNIRNISVNYAFSEYVMENISAKNQKKILYTNDAGVPMEYKADKNVDDSLTYLNEIGRIKSEYLQLCEEITKPGSKSNIKWRIESGNRMVYVQSAGRLPTISTLAEMNGKLANYYYCKESFDTFVKGHLYRMFLSNGSIAYEDMGTALLASSPADIENYQITAEDRASFGAPDPSLLPQNEVSVTKGEQTLIAGPYHPENENNGPITESRNKYRYKITVDGTVFEDIRYLGLNHYRRTNIKAYKNYSYADGAVAGTFTKEFYYAGTNGSIQLNGSTYPIRKEMVVRFEYAYIDGKILCTSYTETVTEDAYEIVYSTKANGSNPTTVTSDKWTTLEYVQQKQKSFLGFTWWDDVSGTNRNIPNPKKETVTDRSNDTVTDHQTLSSFTLERALSPIRYSSVLELNSQNRTQVEETALNVHNTPLLRYIYSGPTGKEALYVNGTDVSQRYQNNRMYEYGFTEQGYQWTYIGNAPSAPSGKTMDDYLNEANTHLNDLHYGEYYGKYFAYAGNSITTNTGNTYQKQGVYRLLIGADGKFYYEHDDLEKFGLPKNTFQEMNDTAQFLEKTLSAKTENIGDLYFFTKEGTQNETMYYESRKFYILDYNKDTESYYLRRFEIVDYNFKISGGKNILRFENGRIYYGDRYSGTGGTYTAVVTAIINVGNEEYLRKFKIDVIG